MAAQMPTEAQLLHRLIRAGLKAPRRVIVAITNRCNLRCGHCWPESGPEDDAPVVAKADLVRLIDAMVALGATRITLTGGEPLTHPDWSDLLAYACASPDIEEVCLQTNAILIGPEEAQILSRIGDAGKLVIQTSLEGASDPVHDRVRGKGSFDQTMRGLQRLVARGLADRICVTFTEMVHNFEAIPELMALIEKMGIRRFVTGTLVAGGRAETSMGMGPPTADQYAWLVARYQTDTAFRERYDRMGNIAALEWYLAASPHADLCCSFIETPYVTADGRFYPCVMLQDEAVAAAGVYEASLTAVLAEKITAWSRLQEIKLARLSQLDGCRQCPAYAACGAGCMGRAVAAYGDYYAAEDRCGLRQAVHRCRVQGC
jgi:radical SAM protein with 4Fe4S-binding SPASM domain